MSQLPLIDVPKLTPEVRALLQEMFDQMSRFDPKAVIRGHDPRKVKP